MTKSFRSIMQAQGYAAFVSVSELPADLAAKASKLRAKEEDDFLVTLLVERNKAAIALTPARCLQHMVTCAGGPERINWGAMPQIVMF